MSAQADTNCHDIFNFVSATRTHLAKIGATHCVVADMSQHVGNISSEAVLHHLQYLAERPFLGAPEVCVWKGHGLDVL